MAQNNGKWTVQICRVSVTCSGMKVSALGLVQAMGIDASYGEILHYLRLRACAK